MNKIKKCKLLALLTLLFAAALTLFSSCKSNFTPLPTPVNLQINGTILSWDEVENASGYLIDLNGEEQTTTFNTYDLSSLTEGTYKIQVSCIGDGEKYADSEWSKIKNYTVKPQAEQCLEFAFCNEQKNQLNVVGIGSVTSKEIVVPSFHNGFPVIEIESLAFENCTNLTSVTLPESLKDIRSFVFAGCSSLEHITIPQNVENIYPYALSGTGIKSLDLSNTVCEIVNISNCPNLESVKFSNKQSCIFIECFYNTPKLKSLTLSDRVSIISTHAFQGSGIETLKIPKSVFSIDKNAFEGSIIKSIEFEEGSELKEIGNYAFRNVTTLESIVIPSALETLGLCAFEGCTNLTSVIFEDNCALTTLRSFTFMNCSNLTTFDFGKNCALKEMHSCVFKNCTKLESITIPPSLTYLATSNFEGCNSIKSIIIPATVETLGPKTFYGWTKDQTIYLEKQPDDPALNEYTFKECNATIVWGYQPQE